MIKAAALMVLTGIALVITVALIVGAVWVAVAIPVSICAVVAHGIGAMARGERPGKPRASGRGLDAVTHAARTAEASRPAPSPIRGVRGREVVSGRMTES